MTLDAVVIGAGAAGLSAAETLAAAKKRFVVLEARRRVGGRAWTRRVLGHPVELGPEFVHGRPKITLEKLAAAGLKARAIEGDDGDFWAGIDAVLEKLDARAPDKPFAEALKAMRGISRGQARRAADFVRSFHAADLRLISARDLAEQQKDAESQRDLLRLENGYGALMAALAGRLPARCLRPSCVVDAVSWRADGVEVDFRAAGGRRSIAARAAIVALPLGVLKAAPGEKGAVRFAPPLPGPTRAALAGLQMGHVAKAVLAFKPAFWRGFGARLKDTFLRDPQGPFSVFWTASPLDAPLVTAWVGGPPALAVAALGKDRIAAAAVAGLARASGQSAGALRRALLGAYFHDWTSDPFSRGAYSYAAAGAYGARAVLARPVDDVLFFAGEACDVGGQSATVAGALESGRRAAKLLLAALAN